jgi:hypothetical protein
MGIRFYCPNGHKLNVKTFQAGRRGICPYCGEKTLIPTQSTRPSSKAERLARLAGVESLAIGKADEAGYDLGGGVSAAIATQNLDAPAGDPQNADDAEELTLADADVSERELPPEPSASDSQATFSPGAKPADPLAEKSEVVWYVRPPSGGQYGPGTTDVIRGWLAEGRISPDTLVWREGWRDWQEAGSVFPQLNPLLTNPLAAIGPATATTIIPQRSTPPTPPSGGMPAGLTWLIGSLAIFTVLVIAALIAYMVR